MAMDPSLTHEVQTKMAALRPQELAQDCDAAELARRGSRDSAP